MCGLVGVLSFAQGRFRVGEAFVTRMRDTIAHRGPDGAGTWVSEDKRIGLGHRRLSIIDLSRAAAQPMWDSRGHLCIVFNGEIYNHAQLRKELDALSPRRWRTDHSDTEVILEAFLEWGIGCLDRFRGMFAFALWDTRDRTLWLVRDRIGIKPLYYSIHHGRIVFASEIKALLRDPDIGRKVDEEALFHYLSFCVSPAPRTMFEGIAKLRAGTWLRVGEDGQTREETYWDPLDRPAPLSGAGESEIAEHLLDELRVAVKLRKAGDVPLGVFLSGGIDSSTNAVLFGEGREAPVETFTVGYRGNGLSLPNETDHARRMADHLGAKNHQRFLDEKEVLEFLPKMAWLQDEPIADPVCVPVFFVSQLARARGVTVCQVGEGADELFIGYPLWRRYLRLQQFDDLPVPRLLKRLGLGALSLLGQSGTPHYELLRRGAEGVPVFWSGALAFTEMRKRQIFSKRLRDKFRGRTSWEAIAPFHERYLAKAAEPTWANWMSYADLKLRLPELLLMRLDKMCMASGLEGRVPFLDHRFVELALGIPDAIKLGDGSLKYILRKAVSDILPPEVLKRRKQGFGVPIRDWYGTALGAYVQDEITSFARETDFFEAREIAGLTRRKYPNEAWTVFNLALWSKAYLTG